MRYKTESLHDIIDEKKIVSKKKKKNSGWLKTSYVQKMISDAWQIRIVVERQDLKFKELKWLVGNRVELKEIAKPI